jgi:hypothetical protein
MSRREAYRAIHTAVSVAGRTVTNARWATSARG